MSTLSLNLLLEKVYLEGQIHMMYEEILKEETNSNDIENESMVKKVISDLKLNADFMLTFGVGIGAFAGPVSELLSNQNLRITKYDVTLLVITALYVLLTKSKKDVDILMSKVKEQKLESELKKVIKFVNGTLGLFKVIGNKVGVTVTTLVDVLAFTFMSIPVLNLIKSIAAEKGYNIDNVEQLFSGLILSAGTYLLRNVLKKRIKESEDDELDWAREIVQNTVDPTTLEGEALATEIEKIFRGTDFKVIDQNYGGRDYYRIYDSTGGYEDIYTEEFNVPSLRKKLKHSIEMLNASRDFDVRDEYIVLYDVLKPFLFGGKQYYEI